MAKRFAFIYLMKRAPERIREVVPSHVQYWRSQNLPGYTGGPFADRSGGLILFDAASAENATSLADADPFVQSDLLEARWVKEWLPE